MVAGYVLLAWSIDHLELTVVEPLLTTYLIWALLLAVPMSRQPVKAAEVIGALILIGGVTLLSLSRSTTPVGLSFGSLSHWYAAAIIAGVAFIAVVIGHRRQGQVRATLTGVAAGLVFGIQDALTRQTLQGLQGHSWTVLFTTWSAYALVGAGILGIWLMQNAFSAAPLHASLPAIAACEPLAGIALGIVVFGDRVQVTPGMLAIEAGGIAALIVGVIAVARSSAFSGLRKITDVIRPGPDGADSRTPDGPAAHPSGDGAPRRSLRRPPDGAVDGAVSAAPVNGVVPDGPVNGWSPTARRRGSSPAPRTGGRFTTPRPAATAAEPARPRRGRAQPRGTDRDAPRFSIRSSVALMLPSVTISRLTITIIDGQGPEVAAHPQDRRADLLVGERRAA